MDLTEAKFLLDENVPRRLKAIFKSKKLECWTVQELGWREIKNGLLSVRLKRNDFVLVTRDKDFVLALLKANFMNYCAKLEIVNLIISNFLI